jgi:ubiquinone/menaquinone biosynthesis C-methylase UbiE
MTRPLAGMFHVVHAIDISPEMLDYAKAHVPNTNIQWHISDGASLPLADRSVTAVFSCLVFQHLPSIAAGMNYFSEAARVLAPGGSLVIQLPLHRHPPLHRRLATASRRLHGAYFALYSAMASYRRWRMRRGGRPYMHGLSYDEGDLRDALIRMGFSEVEFATYWMKTNGSLQTCVYALR